MPLRTPISDEVGALGVAARVDDAPQALDRERVGAGTWRSNTSSTIRATMCGPKVAAVDLADALDAVVGR